MTEGGETELTEKVEDGWVDAGLEEELPQPAAHSRRLAQRVATTGPIHLMTAQVYSCAARIGIVICKSDIRIVQNTFPIRRHCRFHLRYIKACDSFVYIDMLSPFACGVYVRDSGQA
jgi:hypothetical protein